MTFFEVYLFFGIPLIAIGLGFGALWLVGPVERKSR